MLLLVAAFVGSYGTLAGSFADGDHVFVERYADSATRVRDIVSGYLLVFAGLAFGWFAQALSRVAPLQRAPILLAGSAAAGAMILTALAWTTVPMSITFGTFFDDPGLEQGQAVLGQFGYVTLMMGAMVPAAVVMIAVARAPGLLPRWLSIASYPVAVLVSLSALLFSPLFLFVGWVVAVAVTQWRRRESALRS